MRDVWTKMSFLDLFSRLASLANGTILICFAERHVHCIDDKVHLAVRGWPASTSHVLRFICACGFQICFTRGECGFAFFLFVQVSALCFLTFHLEQVFLSVCDVSGHVALFSKGCQMVG